MQKPSFLPFLLAASLILPLAWTQEEDPEAQAAALLEAGDQALQEFEKKASELPTLQGQGQRLHDEAQAAEAKGDRANAQRLHDELQSLQNQVAGLQAELTELYGRAMDNYDRALAGDPGLGRAHTGRATLRFATGDMDGGKADLEKGVELAPDYIQNYFLRAVYRFGMMEWSGSMEDLERCVAVGHKVERLRDIRAQILLFQERFTDAAAVFDEIAKEGMPSAGQMAQIAREYVGYLEEEGRIRAAEGTRDDLPRAKFVTSKGEIVIELFEDQAPNTVANFIHLAEKGFYDGMRFHRVIPNFMAQCGDPLSKDEDPSNDGQGGPGYRIKDELAPGYRRHFACVLSMANTGDPDTGGSQFFLTFVPTWHLNGKHTVFGRVIEGMDVLYKVRKMSVLERVVVLRKREHAYEPETIAE